MKIRIIGSKSEIETFCKTLERDFPDMTKSRLYPAKEGGYRCYVDIKNQRKEVNKMKSEILFRGKTEDG